MSHFDVSVVIGFRDWGLQRLRLAISSIQNSFGQYVGEVILSDYGSIEHAETERLALELGAKYIYTERSPEWSRSRALNAGFSIAEGDFFVSTDADMVFTPTSFERIIEYSRSKPSAAFFLQCRDLPEGMNDDWVRQHPGEWDAMETASRIRPRWGMGGMMAISRAGFEKIHGFDERMHTYGGEDLDFAQRARRGGFKTVWIDDPDVRMYHMWHAPTIRTVEKSEQGAEAVKANRSIVYNDKTYIRNYKDWEFERKDRLPLVTVAISTYNRAELLRETICSVLNQTVQDFEIVVVDDGGSDNAETVVASFNDPRIRYFWKENGGISSARNFAADHSRGLFTAVIDDDDLMHPKRLEWQLDAMNDGLAGNVGCFVNFDNLTGETKLYVGKNPTPERSIPKGTAPGHGTWMVRTDILRTIRYDENLSSGVDNNIFLRMLRTGARFGHTGKPLTLRRMHAAQVTQTDATNQTNAAANVLGFLRWGYDSDEFKRAESLASATPQWPKVADKQALIDEVIPYLPDHLTERQLVFTSPELIDKDWTGSLSETAIRWFNADNQVIREEKTAVLQNATYDDMIQARQLGLKYTAIADQGDGDSGEQFETIAASIFNKSMSANHEYAVITLADGINPSRLEIEVHPESSFTEVVQNRDTSKNLIVVSSNPLEQ